MPTTRRAALSALAIASTVPVIGAAQTRWQMATPYPDGNFHTRNIREFLAEVEQATGGKLAVQLHSNASLLPLPQIKRGVQQGQVQMGEILLSAYANEDPLFDVDSIPFLVADLKEAKRLGDLMESSAEIRTRYVDCVQLHIDLQEHFSKPAVGDAKPTSSPVLSSLTLGGLPGAASYTPTKD